MFPTIFKCWYLWAQDEARAKERGRVLASAAVEVAVFGAPCRALRALRAMKNESPVSGSFVFKTCCWGGSAQLQKYQEYTPKRFKNGYYIVIY